MERALSLLHTYMNSAPACMQMPVVRRLRLQPIHVLDHADAKGPLRCSVSAANGLLQPHMRKLQ